MVISRTSACTRNVFFLGQLEQARCRRFAGSTPTARIGCGIVGPPERDRSGVIRYSAFGASFSCHRPRRVAEAEACIEKPSRGTLARSDQPFRFHLGSRIDPNSKDVSFT